MCRKAHGAGYVTWAGFEQDQFRLAAGADQLQWFESSTGASRGFCNQCGSSLLFRSERWPEEIHVAVGCIDGELDRRPEANVFFDTHVNWMQVDSSIRVVNP